MLQINRSIAFSRIIAVLLKFLSIFIILLGFLKFLITCALDSISFPESLLLRNQCLLVYFLKNIPCSYRLNSISTDFKQRQKYFKEHQTKYIHIGKEFSLITIKYVIYILLQKSIYDIFFDGQNTIN